MDKDARKQPTSAQSKYLTSNDSQNMARLRVIIEEYMEESGLQNQTLSKYIEPLEGDLHPAQPEIEIAGVGHPEDPMPEIKIGGQSGGVETDINIGGKPNVGETGSSPLKFKASNTGSLPPKVADALKTLQSGISKVDKTVAEVGGDLYMVDLWWPKARQLIVERKYVEAKARIKEFLQPFDANYANQKKLIDSLEALEKIL